MRKLRRRKRLIKFRMVTLVGEGELRIKVWRESRGRRKNRAGKRGRGEEGKKLEKDEDEKMEDR